MRTFPSPALERRLFSHSFIVVKLMWWNFGVLKNAIIKKIISTDFFSRQHVSFVDKCADVYLPHSHICRFVISHTMPFFHCKNVSISITVPLEVTIQAKTNNFCVEMRFADSIPKSNKAARAKKEHQKVMETKNKSKYTTRFIGIVCIVFFFKQARTHSGAHIDICLRTTYKRYLLHTLCDVMIFI